MKRICIAFLFLLSHAAYADDFFFKPYLGLDYNYYDVSYKNISGTPYNYGDIFDSSFNGGDVHIGVRVHKYLGLEASYFDTMNSDKSGILGTTASSSAKLRGEALDAMAYLPIGNSKAELIGTIGIARTEASGSVTVSGTRYSLSDTEYKGRIGAGAQYWFTENLNVRGIVRWQDANFHGAVSDAVVVSAGVNWQF